MQPEFVATVVCPRCSAEQPAAAAMCDRCGMPLARPAATPAASSAAKKRLVDNPWAVLAAIFFAMAAFGIPLLWISRGFSPRMRVFWSIVTVLYTCLLLWLFYLVMSWSIGNIVDAWRKF